MNDSTNQEYQDSWIRLARSLSSIQFWKKIHTYKCPKEVIMSESQLRYSICDLSKEKDIVMQKNCTWILYNDPLYPKYLKEIQDAPPVLIAKGNVNILQRPCISVVGSRNCSISGTNFTHQIVQELGQKGWCIVSGLARGIDAAAHRASLNTGTIAILAGGVDNIYPEENTSLYNAILDNDGLIISENCMGAAPMQKSFPSRNRIIAGIGMGLLVIEATLKSGSLITARLAGEYGREIFATPGHPYDPRSSGGNFLIKNGATMLQSASDVELEMPGLQQYIRNQTLIETEKCVKSNDLNEIEIMIMRALTCSQTDIDELCSFIKQNSSVVRSALTMLEIKEMVKVLNNGYVIKIKH